MANTSTFSISKPSNTNLPRASALNVSGQTAYAHTPKHILAQLSVIGTFYSTEYMDENSQVKLALSLCAILDPLYIGKCAIYAHNHRRKDYPAFLCAYLSKVSPEIFKKVFPRVITTGRILRNFVQIMRSGVIGRRSLGTLPKKLIQNWLNDRAPNKLFHDSIGKNPSIAQVIKLAHPRPKDEERRQLFAYILGREYTFEKLPKLVQQYELFKQNPSLNLVPLVDFRQLSSLKLTSENWKDLFRKGSYTFTRMNLNNAAKHGVLQDSQMVKLLANRLQDITLVRQSKVYPHELLMTLLYVQHNNMPEIIKDAIIQALEISVYNVVNFACNVIVCPDISASMRWIPITGQRKGGTSKASCIDLAALFTAVVYLKNPNTLVLPFASEVVTDLNLQDTDSVMSIITKILDCGSGATNCSLPLKTINDQGLTPDLVIYISDNESNLDPSPNGNNSNVMLEWSKLRLRNPKAKLVNIDLSPNQTTQAPNRQDILNIGGFDDSIFQVIRDFVNTESPEHFVQFIEQIDLK